MFSRFGRRGSNEKTSYDELAGIDHSEVASSADDAQSQANSIISFNQVQQLQLSPGTDSVNESSMYMSDQDYSVQVGSRATSGAGDDDEEGGFHMQAAVEFISKPIDERLTIAGMMNGGGGDDDIDNMTVGSRPGSDNYIPGSPVVFDQEEDEKTTTSGAFPAALESHLQLDLDNMKVFHAEMGAPGSPDSSQHPQAVERAVPPVKLPFSFPLSEDVEVSAITQDASTAPLPQKPGRTHEEDSDDSDSHMEQRPVSPVVKWWMDSAGGIKCLLVVAFCLFLAAVILVPAGLILAAVDDDDDSNSKPIGPQLTPSPSLRPTASPGGVNPTTTDPPNPTMAPSATRIVSEIPTSPIVTERPASPNGTPGPNTLEPITTRSPSIPPELTFAPTQTASNSSSTTVAPTTIATDEPTAVLTVSPTTSPPTPETSPSAPPVAIPTPTPTASSTTLAPTGIPTPSPTQLPSPSPSLRPRTASPNPVPVTDPTASPTTTTSQCRDSTEPFSIGDVERDCAWVASSSVNRFVYCTPEYESYLQCPDTCETCDQVVEPTCVDGEETFIVGGNERDCQWIADNTSNQLVYCTPGRNVYEICRLSCGNC